MKFDKFTPLDEVVFIGDPNYIKDKHGEFIYCPLVNGETYTISQLVFWGNMEFIRLEGYETFYQVELFVSVEEYGKINEIVSDILK